MKIAWTLVVLPCLLIAACGPKEPPSPSRTHPGTESDTEKSRQSHNGDQLKVPASVRPEEDPIGTETDVDATPLVHGYSRELRLLLVEQRFRWETRALNEALKRDRGLAYQGFFTDAQDGWTQPTSIWSEEVKRRVKPLTAPFYDAEHNLMVGRKDNQIQLDYDVVIIGDVEPDSFLWRPTYWDWIESWVKQGGGLILLAGSVHNPMDYTGNESFQKLCPVTLEVPPGGESIVDTSVEKYTARTTAGKNHELFLLHGEKARRDELFGTEEDSRYRPGELHGFYWYQVAGRAVDGATVLAGVAREGEPTANGVPLIVSREYGDGRVLYLGTDEFHYWRQWVGDYYFYKFWQNAIRWVAKDPGK